HQRHRELGVAVGLVGEGSVVAQEDDAAGAVAADVDGKEGERRGAAEAVGAVRPGAARLAGAVATDAGAGRRARATVHGAVGVSETVVAGPRAARVLATVDGIVEADPQPARKQGLRAGRAVEERGIRGGDGAGPRRAATVAVGENVEDDLVRGVGD